MYFFTGCDIVLILVTDRYFQGAEGAKYNRTKNIIRFLYMM